MMRYLRWLAHRSGDPLGAVVLLVLSVFCAWFFGPLHERSWHGDPIGRIPPGREAIVEPWIDALKNQGVTVESAQIQQESIRMLCVVTADDGRTTKGTVSLVRPGTPNDHRISESFGVQVDGAGFDQAQERRLLRAFEVVLSQGDDGSFFRAKSSDRFQVQETRAGLWFEGSVRFSLEVMTWFILFALFVLLLRWSGQGGALPRREWLVLWSLAILAAILRLALPEAGPIHANGHGLHELSSFTSARLGPGDGWADGSYGVGGAVVFRFVAFLTGSSGTDLLRWMAILLSMFTPVIALSVRALGGDRYAARMAALLYAITPILVRASPTETPLLLATLWAVFAGYLAFGVLTKERWDWTLFVMAIAMMSLSVQSHVVTVVWLIPWSVGCGLYFGRSRVRGALLTVSVWLLCAPHLAHVIQSYGVANDRGMNPGARVVEQFGQPGIAIFNMFITPFGVTIMGLIALLVTRGRALLILWVGFALTVPLFVSVTQTLSDVIRYQAPLVLALVMMASLSLSILVRRAKSEIEQRSLRAILSGIVLLTVMPTIGLYSVPDPETRISALVEEASKRGLLDRGLTVPEVNSNERKSGFGAPSWALPPQAPRNTDKTALVLLGSRCVTWGKEGERPSDSLHPTCARLVGAKPEPVLVSDPIPYSFAGLSLWFYPRRSGSVGPGVYQPIRVNP